MKGSYVWRVRGVTRNLNPPPPFRSAVSFCKCVYVGVADKSSVLWDVKIVETLKHNERGSYELFS